MDLDVDVDLFEPSLAPESMYSKAEWCFSDGLVETYGGLLVSGAVLNHGFSNPWFDPERVYFIFQGQILLVPEHES